MLRWTRATRVSIGAVLAVLLSIPVAATSAGAATEGFRDVTGDHLFYREISWFSQEGITTGFADDSFRPGRYVSRAAFAAFLYRLEGRPDVSEPADPPFRDLSPSHQFYREIVWMWREGITTGWSDGTFRPDTHITRDAMAAFLYRYEGRPPHDAPRTSVFSDVPRDAPFYKEITWLRSAGLTTGWPDGTFRPYQGTSREATAAFLFRGYGPSDYQAPEYAPPTTWDPDREVWHMTYDPYSVLVVVNKRRPLSPSHYSPPDLVTVQGVPGGSDDRLREETVRQLAAMHSAAESDGASFWVVSSYRSHSYQADLFEDYAEQHGVEAAETFSARPAHSEHQTGWAVDVAADGCSLSACFGDTAAGRWIAANGHEYGFIIRYPEGQSHITGYRYEPWHLRYVGIGLASHMHDRGVATLEEQFGLPWAPDYP
ncbi:D-alanyl-D-alanine carboxypeptidase family protein [Demequina sp. SO4-13]|uniref:D-alanyl-D-alanine carboxypeptidase family protein n=1 Tax=Demequina sp. SO4-13 TaxID=3401027 RepID=UPI003AF7A673